MTMIATPLQTTAQPIIQPTTTPHRKARTSDAVRSEWIKFWSVRSMWSTLLWAGLATVAFGVIFSSIAGTDALDSTPAGGLTGPIELALSGANITEMVIGVLGVIMVAGEYSTGLIRTSFGAVGRRSRVIKAKAAVLGGTVLAIGTVSAFLSLLLGQLVYSGNQATIPMADLVDVTLGTGVYFSGVALIGLALGFILRSTAAGIGTMVAFVFIGPELLALLPKSATDVFMKFMPSHTGSAMMSNVTNPDLLSTGAAYAVLAGWVVGLLLVANALVGRRDA